MERPELMRKIKLLFVTGSRGEWGYIRPILELIGKSDKFSYELCVTNMHLLPSFGNSYKEIENDGFKKGANRDIKIKENDLLDAQLLIEDFKNNIENTNLSKFTINSKIQDYSSEGLDIKKLYHHKNNLTLCPYTIIYENSLEPNSRNLIRLGDVFDIHKGTLQSTKSEPGEYRFITASSDKFYHENYDKNLTGPSIIIATGAGGSLGKVQFFNGKFIASDLCHVLKQKSNTELDLYFYFYYFKKYKSLIEKVVAKGVSKRAINQTNLANLRIHTFSLEEQQRVGKIVKENLEKLLFRLMRILW